jgi:hypothetical protein
MSNILNEELNRIKSLFVYQKGKVISEQQNPQSVADNIVQAAAASFGTDEQKIVDSFLSIKDKAEYDEVQKAYNAKGYKGTLIDLINKEFERTDGKYVKTIADHLTKLGFQVKSGIKTVNYSSGPIEEFDNNFQITNQAATQTPQLDRQKNINTVFCNVKSGLVVYPGSILDKTPWVDYVKKYTVTTQEIEEAKKSCPQSELAVKSSANRQVTFTPNETFPLKFKQKGENIKSIQQQLNMPKNLQTGNFYTRTEQYIKNVAPEYNRTTGVTEDIWNKIFNAKAKPATPEQTIAPENNTPTTNPPTNLNAQPANLTPNPAFQQKK